MAPRLYTIPPSAPFLPTLIRALLDGKLIAGFPASRDPLALAGVTLYLPTRRAGELARTAFLDVLGNAVLPRIVPLGEIDEDELAFAQAATGQAALELPEALGGLERRLLLARLVLRWIGTPALRTGTGKPLVANTPAAALALADSLARLMDDMTTRQVPWDRLDKLVPDQFDEYWAKTLDFLRIARDNWPAILAERERIEPAERRDQLIEAERQRLLGTDGPVIAAGSTGSMPATAKLLATIAKLPHGAVVLPGLDTALDAETWELAGKTAGHPQFAMHALLSRIGAARDEVVRLGEPSPREHLLSEALRRADATDRWAARLDTAQRGAALGGLTMIEAANAEEEALALAVALRDAVERRKSAALVTPDRALARRVGAALERWAITADDSGGDALPDTEAGVFSRLAIEVALGGVPPVTLLALAKHPRLRLGAAAGAHRRATAALEQAVLRGPRPRAGCDGLAGALIRLREERGKIKRGEAADLHASDPRLRLYDNDLDAAQAFVAALATALAPLESLKGHAPLRAIAALHRDVLIALSTDETGVPVAFSQDDGAMLADAFDEFAEQAPADDLAIATGDYGELFEQAIAERVCRRRGAPGAAVQILGPLEARLINIDCVALGGLVEGVWPPEAHADPWLSRPMRLDLGLDLPERRIGLSAHDVAQLLGAPEVVLSRAAKVAGAPTVTSRFLQRLAAVAGEGWGKAVKRGGQYLAFARALDRAAKIEPIRRPRPRPPLSARPARLSVTEIESLLRDPYTIYAKHVLALRPLDPVDTPPGARDRGTLIHGAIGDFTEAYAERLPADPLRALLAFGEKRFTPLQDFPEARAFWWPRFLRIARWFIGWETLRRANAIALHAEVKGELKITIDKWTFRLVTRADRIEALADGSYAILDYKTGATPTEPQVRTGLSPQLTLEGAILRQGGFKGIAAGSISELAYVSLRGREPPGETKLIDLKEGSPDFHADKALTRLKGVLHRFALEKEPYRSLVSPMWKARYGDYDHLARIAEWSAGGEDEEGGE